jgi:hypothetical protein
MQHMAVDMSVEITERENVFVCVRVSCIEQIVFYSTVTMHSKQMK